MENVKNPKSMAAGFGMPAWARLGVSPIAAAHGTGLSFAAAYGTDARQLVTVPDPRGRQR